MNQMILIFMIEGNCGSAVARRLKVSDSTIRATQRHLDINALNPIGSSSLIDIQHRPQWE
jgi:hypothetical protein